MRTLRMEIISTNLQIINLEKAVKMYPIVSLVNRILEKKPNWERGVRTQENLKHFQEKMA